MRIEGDAYIAGCVTANLFSFGKTVAKAKTRLIEVINIYDELSNLVGCPSPLFMHVDYAICWLLRFVNNKKYDIFEVKR